MAKVRQWLSARSALSDWETDTKTGAGNKVSLEKQSPGFSAHPLTLAKPRMQGAGLQGASDLEPVARLPVNELEALAEMQSANLEDVSEVGYQRPQTPETARLPIYEFGTGAGLEAVDANDIAEVGYQRPSPWATSRVPIYDSDEPDLWDLLATEDLDPIATQDGEPLGMA